MYHYRVMPFSGKRAEVDHERHKRYVEYWGGNENIGRYILDRSGANHELVLFLEDVPHVLRSWLPENPCRAPPALGPPAPPHPLFSKHTLFPFSLPLHHFHP